MRDQATPEEIQNTLMSYYSQSNEGTASTGAMPSAEQTPQEEPMNAESILGPSPFKAGAPKVGSPPPATAAPKPTSMWHQARTASPAGTPEPSWGSTLTSAGANLIPSTFGALKATGTAIAHPLDTASALGDLAKGVYSQVKGSMGLQHDEKDETLIKALEDHYKQTYGSVAGFKKALGEDPAGILMDASTFLTAGAGAAGKLGAVEKAAALSKLAGKLDPVTGALKVAGAVAKAPAKILRSSVAATSGMPVYAQEMATKAGTGPKRFRDIYKKFASGEGEPTEYLDTAQSALEKDKAQAVQEYRQSKGNLQLGTPSFQKIDDAIAAARSETQRNGPNTLAFKPSNDALNEVESLVQEYKNNPHDIYAFDNLKQAIGDIKNQTGNSFANRHLGSIYNSVKGAIRDVDPAYDDIMEKYSMAMNGVNDAKKLMGAGDKAGASASMAKSLRSIKDSTGVNMIERMAKHEPDLPYMLAGHSANSNYAGVMRGIGDMMGSAMLGYAVHPAAGLASLVGGSPRVVGKANYLAGRLGSKTGIAPVSRAISSVASKIPPKSIYYAGRANQENVPDESQPATSTDEGGTFSRMLRQESGDRQLDKNGEPITSSAGAIGAAQVMPGTGPEAAQLAGLPWDEDKFRHDADYNRKLGEAYFNHQKDVFGDERHAVAAYNAGPERVKKALADAKTSGKDFLEHLPPETQNYVRKVLGHAAGGRINRASGGRLDGIEPLVQRLMSKYMQAKKATDKITEPLLNEPDEHIVHALKVAQDAI